MGFVLVSPSVFLAGLALFAVSGSAQVPERVVIDVHAPGRPFPHFWEQTFGSGRAILTLRESEVNSQIIPSITTSYSQEYVVIYGFYAYWAGPWATWTGLPTGAINLLGTNLDISSVSDGFAFYGLPAAVPPNTTISGVTENIVATWILGGVTFTLIPGP